MFFKNGINITFIWCINKILLLNIISFHFPQTFLRINLISLSVLTVLAWNLLIASILCKFLATFVHFMEAVNAANNK